MLGVRLLSFLSLYRLSPILLDRRFWNAKESFHRFGELIQGLLALRRLRLHAFMIA